MRVIPAIDLKDGQCVRLQKGDYGTAHKVAENPVETAQRFLDAGADLVHMVDLDAAKELRVKRWEEAGGRIEKSRLCFISALHSFFFTRKREFEAEKAAHCVGSAL